MLGTNPFSVAAPAGEHHPFVLDMSTTAAPTGKVRAAARDGQPVPVGWLADDRNEPVTDPAAFDRGDAHLLWLGGAGSGAYKGFGLGLTVEVLAALVSGSASGPGRQALAGAGTPGGRDDDIGFLAVAIAPGLLRPTDDVDRDAHALFDAVLACPPTDPAAPVRYPGWYEAEAAVRHRRSGVPLDASVHGELRTVADRFGLAAPEPYGPDRCGLA
jgi:LDH2 family malate/lactate/ureidoglycolate dehydrogenase